MTGDGDIRPSAKPVAFLPGAAGAAEFWSPVAAQLPESWQKRLFSWPGAGDQPHDPRVGSFDDLVELTAAELDDHSDLVAQSMGGVVAIGAALRHPRKVRRLVLVATSGGIDMTGLSGVDWRAEYRREYPRAAPWIWLERPDYGAAITGLDAPALLIWGDADPLSPLAVGRRLHELLPNSILHVAPGGEHDLAREHADAIAPLIAEHLR